ncbi:MAG: tRNA pseudouridine(38-40) synthase TruA [Nitrospirae bacterium]|nr:tRNA pseudouridine(38-40) synthase TruA [Nitrospirota bacterium]
MRNIKLVMQYDGTHYHGWQVQPGTATIQSVLQERIATITGEEISSIAAGRTDAGVHALAQVAAFKTTSRLSCDTLKNALNALLPGDIRITAASDADLSFHPRYDAKGKVYFYIVANMQVLSPFLHNYAWRVPQPLDLQSMCSAANFMHGTHDFTSFRASGCGAKTPIKTIFHSTIERLDSLEFMTAGLSGNFLKLRIEGDGFLRHMVRNIAGTIVEIGKGKISPDMIEKLFIAKDRRLAGPTAPARGLFLERVNYT